MVGFVVKIVPFACLLRNGRVREFNCKIVCQEPLAATGYFIRATSTLPNNQAGKITPKRSSKLLSSSKLYLIVPTTPILRGI